MLLRALLAVLLAAPLIAEAQATPLHAERPVAPGALHFGACDMPFAMEPGSDAGQVASRLQAWRALRPETYGSTPLPDRVQLVPDTAPQAELHLVFDEDPLVKPALIAMIKAAGPHGTVVLHVRDPDQRFRASTLLERLAPTARLSDQPPPESIWLRDFAGHPAVTAEGSTRIDLKYSSDCVVDDAWPLVFGPSLRLPLYVEGGNLLTDGTRCYATDAIASDNELSLDQAAAALRPMGCVETVWLEAAPATIPHVDPFLALGDPGPDGRPVFVLAQLDPLIDGETHRVLEENARRLAPLGTVLRVPVDQARPLPPALNVQVFNGVVLVPSFDAPLPERTEQVLRTAWPARSLAPVPSSGLAELDGGPHCIAATVPASDGLGCTGCPSPAAWVPSR